MNAILQHEWTFFAPVVRLRQWKNRNTYPIGPLNRDVAGNYLVTGQVPGTTAVHAASDIPLSAFGPGAADFTGVMDNTDVFFKIMQAVLGGACMDVFLGASDARVRSELRQLVLNGGLDVVAGGQMRGANHVILNLKYGQRPAAEVLEELGAHVVPLFPRHDRTGAAGPTESEDYLSLSSIE